MIKQILLLFSLIGLFTSRLFVSDGIDIFQEIPDNIYSGTAFLVKVNIAKGNLDGYANYSLQLPHGLSAELVDASNGNFSFTDQFVNINWVQLPKEKNLVLTYKVLVNKYFKGKVNLSAAFSFINHNKREKILTTAKVLDINPLEENTTESITCEREAPTTAMPGDIFTVKIKVKKGDLTGFAKIQELLPTGFTAEPMETQSAIFSFADQKVKFLWMSLSADPEFTISYKVKVGDEVSGTYKIEGSFFYVVNNETIKQEIASSSITVSTDEVSNSDMTFKGQENPPTNTKTEQQLADEKAAKDQAIADSLKKIQDEEQAKKEAEQKAEEAQRAAEEQAQKQQADQTSAETKKKQEDDTRLQEAAEAQKKADEEAKIAAQAKADEEARIKAEKEKQQQQEEADAKMKADAEAKQKEEENKKQEQASNEQANASKSSSSAAMISKTPEPIKGLNYRVQIAAIKTSVDNDYFKKKYKVAEDIFSETHEGWYKYTVGGYTTYADAKTKRVAVNTDYGIKGPFVTAYNQGKRITVQEALMIAKSNLVQ